MFGRKRITQALIDLNGTCHVGNRLIPHANDAVRKLIDNGVAVTYVTNTTKESTDSIRRRCQSLDLFHQVQFYIKIRHKRNFFKSQFAFTPASMPPSPSWNSAVSTRQCSLSRSKPILRVLIWKRLKNTTLLSSASRLPISIMRSSIKARLVLKYNKYSFMPN